MTSGCRLVSWPLLGYSYLAAGLAEAVTCFIAYMWVFWRNDLGLGDIIFTAGGAAHHMLFFDLNVVCVNLLSRGPLAR